MLYFKEYEPSNSQKDLIRGFQILHMKWEDRESLPPPYITCLANTEQNLYFYPKDRIAVLPTPAAEGTPAPFAAVTGPKNKPVGLKFGRDYLMIKVAFQPTGLYRLLNIPMQKTANRGLNAADFFSGETALIHQQLERSESYDEMFALVSEFMDRQIAKGYQPEDSLDRVAIKMLDPFAKNSLPEWASMACLSLRQFERNFTSRVGISPKTYLRIVRFENAMKVKNQSPEKSWSEIAYECDYDDSSHLLREFRQFAEFPPGKLMHQQTSGYGDFPSG